MKKLEYSAGAVSKGFWFLEFKKYIEGYLEGINHKKLREKQLEENFLMAASNEYGKKMIGELKRRVSALSQDIIELYPSLSVDNQKILNLLGIMINDRLFFEFLYEEYREGLILGRKEFRDSQIRSYFNRKAEQSERVAGFSEGGKNRLRGAYKTYMREANLIIDKDGKSHYNKIILDYQLEKLMEEQFSPYFKAITGGQV